MKSVALAVIALFVMIPMILVDRGQAKHILSRSKRFVGQFASMISCNTGRSAWDYNGYGCYCGLGGRGQPLDETDRCCKAHDECYESLKQSGKCPWNIHVYTVLYKRKGCTGCAWPGFSAIPRCALAACRCDSAAAKCFASKTFNRHHMLYWNGRCK